jgi:hypothetical protein
MAQLRVLYSCGKASIAEIVRLDWLAYLGG